MAKNEQYDSEIQTFFNKVGFSPLRFKITHSCCGTLKSVYFDLNYCIISPIFYQNIFPWVQRKG